MGNSGLRVSTLALGTMQWGEQTDEVTARELLTDYTEAGGTTLDTAAGYTDGRSEAILGELLGDVVSRDSVVLISKAGLRQRGKKRMVDASRRAMLASLDASLVRLGTDHLDLWLAEVWDKNVPIEETLSALDLAVSTGRVRYAGVSNYGGWQLARAASLTDTALVANQVEYSLLARGIEQEVVPAAEHVGTGLLCWAPLGRGVLTGKYRGHTPSDSRLASDQLSGYVERYLEDRPSRITDAVFTAARGLGKEPLDIALSWILDQHLVASAVIGPRTTEQLAQILASNLEPLPEQIFAALHDISN